MFTLNIAGVVLLFVSFLTEFSFILFHNPDKRVVKDMTANVTLGVLVILSGLLEKGLEFGVFTFVYYYSFFTPAITWWLWLICFLGCEFIHFAYHWLGHMTRIFWAAHVTHHSSEFLNLSTGFRTNFIHLFYRFLFYSPLCLFGFPPEMVMLIESLTAIQNFMVHTEKVGKLGVLDWIFNTPSNHRVHHGSNPEYIDKNFGGVLMIFDHLFGTYTKETIKPTYGITHNIHTNNPITILLHEYVHIISDFKKIKGMRGKLRYLFSKPG